MEGKQRTSLLPLDLCVVAVWINVDAHDILSQWDLENLLIFRPQIDLHFTARCLHTSAGVGEIFTGERSRRPKKQHAMPKRFRTNLFVWNFRFLRRFNCFGRL